MQFQSFWFYRIFIFLVVFVCLPLPHGNIYPFLGIVGLCIFQMTQQHVHFKVANYSLLIFLTWCALTIFWANDLTKTLHMYGKVMLIILGGWFWWNHYCQFDNHQQRQLKLSVFVASLVLATLLAVFAINNKLGGLLHKLLDPNISQALVHGCIACSLSIWMNLQHFKKWIQAVILLNLIWVLQSCSSDAAALGIFLGAGTLVMHKILPNFLRTMFIYGMPTVWGILPFIFRALTPEQYIQWSTYLDPSHTHRLFIWHSVTNQIFERFWTGFGFGSSRYRFTHINGQDILLPKGAESIILRAPETCLHPHNFMLQIWLEMGAIGVILGCITWIMYWHKRYKKSDSYEIAFWGSALCVAATGISIWQSWWLILLVMLIPIYKKLSTFFIS